MSIGDKITLVFPFATIAAGTGETWDQVVPFTGVWRVTSAYFNTMTARTADDTNYTTISVKVGSTTIASQTTKITGGSGNLVEGTVLALTITGTAAQCEVTGGSTNVQCVKAESGTGLALDGAFTLGLERVRA